ncbi:MAG: HD domain-containing protein [Saccharospirillaceae bacterium]|nr:HD domain-containing protein [Saccharospirillaceae bacterium]
MKDYLIELLNDLDSIEQHPKYHPEGDALFHSLQVFQLSLIKTDDPIIWAAALFHDVGKAINSAQHDDIGSKMLEGVLHPRIIWLIKHHLNLMKHNKKTIQKYANQDRLKDLQLLRKLDETGRDPFAQVMSVNQAINLIMQHKDRIKHIDN